MEFEWDTISAEDYERIASLHEPLAQAVRRLIHATIHTGADADTIERARLAIDEASQTLEDTPAGRPRTLRHAETGLPVVWINPAAGSHNPIAPPMTTHHDESGRCWSEFTLGPVYEGPPGLVHGGICALLLDQILGEVATERLSTPKFTGTITLKYLRGTPLGPLRAQAWVDRTEGHKTYARGSLSDAQGTTVEAEGVFIMPAWARVTTG
ncbi:PaaI family thioesterase [Mycobacterium sp. M26]|uniref:PaaI family thioesterase n=1 Tax=Mycobacterium sp. M26 TaxID=1762962 RepID=UPI00073E3E45|nr:PaaI family thioesterase [Mycobacterium sp. M26]